MIFLLVEFLTDDSCTSFGTLRMEASCNRHELPTAFEDDNPERCQGLSVSSDIYQYTPT